MKIKKNTKKNIIQKDWTQKHKDYPKKNCTSYINFSDY